MRAFFFIILAVAFSAPACADPGSGEVRAGNAFYRKGKFQEAAGYYEKAAQKNPADPRIEYNLGAAAYKAGDHDAAVDHFQKSLLTDDDKFRRDVHFNLGDALYRSGVAREDREIDQAIKRLESSLLSFEKARALDLKDNEAAENYEFVKKELERLKQKKEQQKQEQKRQQEQQKQEEQEQEQQKQDQQKQDQQKQDQQKQDQQQQEQQQQQDQQKQDQQDQDQQQQEQQQQKDQNKDQQGRQDQPRDDQNDGASGQMAEGQISSQEDAQNMVDDFERNEMPKGLLNFIHRSQEARPVDKDW